MIHNKKRQAQGARSASLSTEQPTANRSLTPVGALTSQVCIKLIM